MRKIIYFTLACVLACFPLVTIKAAEFRSDQSSVTIPEKEQVKNLYLGSNNITVNAPVTGDLVAAGGSIIVNGNVDNSLFVAGGTVTIRGKVSHHLRVLGGTVTLSGSVDGDVFAAGGTVNISKDAVIGGDLFIAGGEVTLEGTIEGTSRISGGTININGNMAETTVWGGNIKVSSEAILHHGLTYYSSTTASIDSAAQVSGSVQYHQLHSQRMNKLLALVSITNLVILLGTILLLTLLIKLFSHKIKKIINLATEKSWQSVGVGFATLLAVPLAVIILIVTVLGIPFALLGGLLWILVLVLGSLMAKLILGSWLLKLFTKQVEFVVDYRTAIIGVLATAIFGAIPIIGGFFTFVLFLFGLGATLIYFKETQVS